MLATSSAPPSVLTNPRYADYNDYIGVYIKEDNIKDNFKKEEIESKDRNLDLSYEQTRAEAEEAKEINRMEVDHDLVSLGLSRLGSSAPLLLPAPPGFLSFYSSLTSPSSEPKSQPVSFLLSEAADPSSVLESLASSVLLWMLK